MVFARFAERFEAQMEMKELPTEHSSRVRDRRIEGVVELIPPAQILDELPLSASQEDAVLGHRSEVVKILDRTDPRLLVIVGPCSVHDVDAALEYAELLRARAAELSDQLCVSMRVYFEKPRTTIGWKGLINDPHLDGSGDVNTGLRMARGLLREVLDRGLPIGCEFLDPITPQYISDLVAWGAIGARTTESQIHRQLASGLSMPVGFKNATDGNVKVAVDAVRAAAVKHAFAGIDVTGAPAILHTQGNRDSHVILRGGRGRPNYDRASVNDALAQLRAAGLPERLVIDASHDNSGKDHEHQPKVVGEIADQVAAGNSAIVGVMLESFLVAGRQDPGQGGEIVYGQSITDACMSWETTDLALDRLAAAAQERRSAG
jgi:3-deoxy-7-phosphoheptulonate synthase